MRASRFFLLVFSLLLFSAESVYGQATGYPPFGSFQIGQFDGINLQDLNANFAIPLIGVNGRHMDFSLSLVYDSSVWRTFQSHWQPMADANGNPIWGWKTASPVGALYYTTSLGQLFKCGPNTFADATVYSNFSYLDPMGTSHPFPINYWVQPCNGAVTGTTAGFATDLSGFYADGRASTVRYPNGAWTDTVSKMEDTNGNYIERNYVNSSEYDWVDTVGRTSAKIITGSTSIQYKFLDGTGTGTYQTATLTLTPTNILTNFGCSGISEFSGTGNLPTELDVPTPSGAVLRYKFSYEPTPGHSGYYTGRLQKVILPTGGSYEYDYGSTNDGINCPDGTGVSMTRKVADGSTVGTWLYSRAPSGSNWVTTVTDAVNNEAKYTFNSSGQQTQETHYQGSSTVLRTVNTTWASNGSPATRVTILEDNNTQSEVDTTYNSNGMLTSMTEYDWGSGAKGAALRTTNLTYQTGAPYYFMVDLVISKQIEDGTGTVKYRQDTAYDGTTITNCPTGVPGHDDNGGGCSNNYRGNPTSVTTYLDPVTPGQGVVTNLTYDVFGNVLTSSVGTTQQQQFNFSSTTQYASPDSIASGPSTGTQLTQNLTYKSDTGLVATSKDPNNQTTTFAYDFLKRITSVTRPDNAQITYAYSESAPFTAGVTSPIDSTRSAQQITAFDALGLPYTTTVEDSTNTVYSIVQTNYDAMGRAYRTSNPYTGSPSYWTTTTFDALSRPTQVQLPDNSLVKVQYATNTVKVTDPAGKQRQSVSDGAGRLKQVFEDPAGLNYETDYTYTVLDALATVKQGAQMRTYNYDALGRPANVTTPEAGMVCFGTVSGSNCQPNGYDNFSNLVARTDARGVVTNYAYDSLNRLIGISYPTVPSGVSAMPNSICNPASGTANSNVCLYYDQGGGSAYALGRLTEMIDPSGSETYAYNNLGETTQSQKVIGSNTYTTNYTYNTGGELTQIQYPSSHYVYQSYDAIGRLCEVAGATISGNCGSTTTPYASGFSYNTAQKVTAFNYGNGVAASLGYSSDRLQMTSLSYAKSGTTLFGLTYAYGTSPTNNGQISGITDTLQGGRTASYTYDALRRLSLASTTGSSSYPAWGLQWAYDRYGNRTAQSIYSGCVTPMTCPTNSVSVNAATNQINTSGYQYDASGNMTNDGYNVLVYDGENRATSANNGNASATYSYDGKGVRIQKAMHNGTTTVYVLSGGRVIAEYDNGAAPSAPSREYVYAGGVLEAKIEAGSTVYYHPDHLSSRLLTDSSGNVAGQQGHFPFGETWYTQNTTTKWEFTTYERDSESGNDYAVARYDVNRLGRFLTVDPVEGSSADPQSLDRYNYVKDDPINMTDPSGLCPQGGSYVPPDQHPKPGASFIGYCLPIPSKLGFGDFGPGDASDEVYEVIVTDTFYGPPDDQTYQGTDITVIDLGSQSSSGLGGGGVGTGGGWGGGNSSGGQTPQTGPSKTGCFVNGVVAGAATALVVGTVATVAVPLVGATAVTVGLAALAVAGTASLSWTAGRDIINHNWAGVAYDSGSLVGGLATGIAGGPTVATAIDPNATPGWSPQSWRAQALDLSKGFPGDWMGTGPTHASAGVATGAGGWLSSLFGAGCH